MTFPYGAPSPALGPWADRLQTASWRGVPFSVRSSTIRRGRRVAVHEYPFRDDVWVEDLGRGMRLIGFTGFLIGDDVFDQRDRMMAACEVADAGDLVHPSLGTVRATLGEPPTASERADIGRVVELEFSFIQVGTDGPVYPTVAADTTGAIGTSADASDTAAGYDFAGSTVGAYYYGPNVVGAGAASVAGFAGLVVAAARAAAAAVPTAVLADIMADSAACTVTPGWEVTRPPLA